MIRVCQKSEIETAFRAELFVGIHAVEAHAQDDCITLGILGLVHLELVGFAGSTRGLIFRVEIEHDPLAAIIAEADCAAVLRGQSERRSVAAHGGSGWPGQEARDEDHQRHNHDQQQDDAQHRSLARPEGSSWRF